MAKNTDNLLIVSMMIGLIVVSAGAFYFRTVLYEVTPQFSELFFPDPHSLPNRLHMGQNYSFTYAIKSNELAETTYNYSTILELYKLYNVTEIRHDCIGRYREKVFLEWTNESDFRLLAEPVHIDEIEHLVVEPGARINWTEYNLNFKFSPPFGRGYLNIFFKGDYVKYQVTIDMRNESIWWNGNRSRGGIDVESNNNELLISAKNHTIFVYLNDEMVLKRYVDDFTDGSFGLESQDAYFGIQNMRLYRDEPIAIPDQGTIIDYSIDAGLMMNKASRLKRLYSQEVRMIRSYERANLSIDCNVEPFYCQYYNMPNDISFRVGGNISTVARKLTTIEQSLFYRMYPIGGEINWTSFTMDFRHPRIEDRSGLILDFSDKWGIFVTRNNSYFLKSMEGEVHIDEIRNPEKEEDFTDWVHIDVNPENIVLKINNETVFDKPAPEDYTGGQPHIYLQYNFPVINEIVVTRDDPECGDEFSFKHCEIIYSGSSRLRVQEDETEVAVNYTFYSTGAFSLFTPEEEQNVTVEEVQLPVFNPFIPDKRIVFYRDHVNSTDFALDYSYQALDGARIMAIGLLEEDGTNIISMNLIERENKAVIVQGEDIITVPIYVNLSTRHVLRLEVVNTTPELYLDRDRVFRGGNVSSGMFYIAARNTYAEFGNVHLYTGTRRKTLSVRDSDPCELRPIYRETKSGLVTLEPFQQANITQDLNVPVDFDFGKVEVTVWGGTPTNESMDIHFWVLRDDS